MVVAALQKNMWVRGSFNLYSMANRMSGAELASSLTAPTDCSHSHP